MSARRRELAYAFALLLFLTPSLAWWLWGRSDASFHVTRVQEAEGALWVNEFAPGRFEQLGRVTRVDPSGELEQHVYATRVELVAASSDIALLRVGGELHAVRSSSADLQPLTLPGFVFAGFDPRGDFVLERDDRTLLTLNRRTLAPVADADSAPTLHLPDEACKPAGAFRAGGRTLRLVEEARGRRWLEDDRGARLGGPFLDAYFILLPGTLASPLGPDAVLVSHRLPDQRHALTRVELTREGALLQPGERWLGESSLQPGAVLGCAPGLLVVETETSGPAVVRMAPGRAPLTTLLSDTR